ncbi:MAG: S41 family peptidase [bacterium]|nr:S41 family peptidase [bacterium]
MRLEFTVSENLKRAAAFCAVSMLIVGAAAAQSAIPDAPIVNDEGGPVAITGTMNYTSPTFARGRSQPIVILEDQAGFVDRDKGFLMPLESQVLGQFTTDFFDPPVSYSIALPIEPQGLYRDVDQDGETDQGVQIYATAYWNNVFGDPYLEERDLYGGGWSTAFASTLVSDDEATLYEIIGGKLLVYAPDDAQGFPSGFGADGLLFTADDPIVRLPQGYTTVILDSDPFTFDRSRTPTYDLIEPEGAALDDFSGLGYTAAFDAMIDKLRAEYAFTELKDIDWDALRAAYRPRFVAAENARDSAAYGRALRDFLWEIPDGHTALYPLSEPLIDDFRNAVIGGVGIIMRQVDGGDVIVTYVGADTPAARAGIEVGAAVVSVNGVPVRDWIANTTAYTGPFSTDIVRALEQTRYATRFPVGSPVTLTYRNPFAVSDATAELSAVIDVETFLESEPVSEAAAFDLPVEYDVLESGYGYARITSFNQNALLTIQLWERLLQTLNETETPGLIIDMRENGGGSGFLADQMAAYFFDQPLILGNTSGYDDSTGTFITDPDRPDRFFLPPENLRYRGDVVVLVSPECASACEFFTYAITRQDRAAVVGQYPTRGLGGGIEDFAMPEGFFVRIAVARPLDTDGNIIIEGAGISPTIKVPVTVETVLTEGDPVLEAAEAYLDGR